MPLNGLAYDNKSLSPTYGWLAAVARRANEEVGFHLIQSRAAVPES